MSNKRYTQVRPTRSVTGGNFNGEFSFELQIPSGELVHLSESYLNAQVTLTKTANWDFEGSANPLANGGNTPARNDSISNNPFGTLFKSAVLFVNDQEVSRSDQYGEHSTVMKIAYDNGDENDSSVSAFDSYPYASTDTYNTAVNLDALQNPEALYADGVVRLVDAEQASMRRRLARYVRDWNSNLIASPQGAGSLKLDLSMPLSPLFVQTSAGDNLRYCKIRLSMTVDPSLKTKIAITPDSDITDVAVDNIFFNVMTSHSDSGVPAGITETYDYLEGYSSVRTLTGSNDNLQYTVPGSLQTVLIAFKKSVTSSSATIDAHRLAGPFGATPITSLYVQYNGKNFPSPNYDFAAGSGRKDALRAYMDYRAFSLAHQNSAGSVLNFNHWLMNPVFIFHVEPADGTMQQTLGVNIGGMDNSFDIVVIGMYPKQLMLSYDDGGRPMSTQVAAVV